MDDYLVDAEDMAMGEFVVSGSKDEGDVSAQNNLCNAELVQNLLGRWGTRPGPDEEIVVQVIARKRPKQPGRTGIRDIRRER